MRIRISADSTCDLSPALIRENNIAIVPLCVNMGDKGYFDGVDIHPADIFAHVAGGGALCTTAAVSVGDYFDRFEELSKDSDAVVHISLGSGFSTSHQNACIAAQELENVYVVDSRNLSTGQGHVVLEACKLAKTAQDVNAMCEELRELSHRVDASFLLNRLDYMVKGGRCSAVMALGANLLRLKPCIEVVDNAMHVGKKYRGNFVNSMREYVKSRLQDADDLLHERIFITHTPVSEEILQTVRQTVRESGDWENIYETTAGCTISCHCGEGCLGVLYIHKKK
ncbi:MAG: DegV family protein [Oscillospiraceae bacterium]|jgi:DegV family protein with EDD domain|nr:DegV family protein [Oscillospiraceae bacterium]